MANNINSKTSNKKQVQRQKGKRVLKKVASHQKRFEVNLPDSEVNTQDLKGYVNATGTSNDPNWYKNIPGLAESYGSLPFNQQLGLQFDPFEATSTSGSLPGTPTFQSVTSNQYATTQVAGILTMDIIPTIGISETPNSPANIAAQQIYSLVRQKNSGAKNYDKTDLMMMIVAMDSAYTVYEDMMRAYRMLGSYNTNNRYLPNSVVTALGYSPTLVASYNDFKGILEMFAFKLASVPVPDVFDFIRRHSWMFSNVYKDAESGKAQMYAFKLAGYYKWVEGSDSSPTKLQWVSRNSWKGVGSDGLISTIETLATIVEDIMNPILGSEDIGTISGDLIKAFDNMITLNPPKDMDLLYPVYNREVLYQIMNLNQTPVDESVGQLDITADLSNLAAGPIIKQKATPDSGFTVNCNAILKKLINMHSENPSVDEVLVATRLMSTINPNTLEFSSYGTEICTAMSIWCMTLIGGVSNGQPYRVPISQHQLDYIMEGQSSDTREIVYGTYQTNSSIMMQLSQFDWAPTLYRWSVSGRAITGGTSAVWYGYMQDLENMNWFSHSDIERLNEVCVMSEFVVKSYPTS